MNPISEIIRARLKKANAQFLSTDNISQFIKEGELDLLQNEVEEKFEGVLESLVIDTKNDHNTKETAHRGQEPSTATAHHIPTSMVLKAMMQSCMLKERY